MLFENQGRVSKDPYEDNIWMSGSSSDWWGIAWMEDSSLVGGMPRFPPVFILDVVVGADLFVVSTGANKWSGISLRSSGYIPFFL